MSIVQWIEETGGIDKVVLVYKNDHDIKRLLVDLLRAEIVDHVKSLMEANGNNIYILYDGYVDERYEFIDALMEK